MNEQVLAVQRMQDYIEKRLYEPITLADLAAVSLFSPWYSYRLFKQQTGLTPADYIRRLRLSRSALRLRREDCRVLDIALECGFGSVDGYQRAFLREFGCDVWGLLTSMDSLCGEPVCLWLPEPYRPKGTSVYVQGVEAEPDYAGEIPEGFDCITLPAAEYLMFQGEPFLEENYPQAICEVQQAIDRYDPSVIGYVWDDANPRIQLEPLGTRGYIELRAVKRP